VVHRRFVRQVLLGLALALAPSVARAQEPPAPVVPTAPEAPSAPPRVELHVVGPYRITLHLVDGWDSLRGPRGSRYRPAISHVVCTAPCDRAVQAMPGQQFFFDAPGIPRSSYFGLDDRPGPTIARVTAGNYRVLEAGAPLTGLGAAVVAAGAFTLGWGFLTASDDPSSVAGTRALKIAGGVTMSVGLGMLITGITLLARGSTHVSFAALPAGGGPHDDR
jgi:hypothetical protein